VAFKVVFHDSVLAFGLAALAGVLTLLAVVAVSTPAQETIRLWIRYRAEHKLAAAERFAVRHRLRAGTYGRRWTRGSAAQIRNSAAAYRSSDTNLPEIMRITRQPDATAPSSGRAAANSGGLSAVGGDGVARGRLGLTSAPDVSAEPQ